MMNRTTILGCCVGCAVVASLATPTPAAAQKLKPYIIQTNTGGDGVSVIDVATDRVVRQITGIEAPNGVAVTPDGQRIFISSEGDDFLAAVDGKTLKEIKRVPVEGEPNGIGYVNGKVYVAINSKPGGVDVFDAKTLARIKHIPLDGVPTHYAVPTKDGKHVVATAQGNEKALFVLDEKTDNVAWTVKFSGNVRVPAFINNPDGSPKWMLVGVSGLSGFVVVDWATREQIRRVETPWSAGKDLLVESAARRGIVGPDGHQTPSHGVAVTPDQKQVWVNSRNDNSVYGYSLPDFKYLGQIAVGYDPMWISFSPDSKKLYEANSGSGTASVVDLTTMEEVLQLRTGNHPSRNDLVLLPY